MLALLRNSPQPRYPPSYTVSTFRVVKDPRGSGVLRTLLRLASNRAPFNALLTTETRTDSRMESEYLVLQSSITCLTSKLQSTVIERLWSGPNEFNIMPIRINNTSVAFYQQLCLRRITHFSALEKLWRRGIDVGQRSVGPTSVQTRNNWGPKISQHPRPY